MTITVMSSPTVTRNTLGIPAEILKALLTVIMNTVILMTRMVSEQARL